jgi:hypothetical protein
LSVRGKHRGGGWKPEILRAEFSTHDDISTVVTGWRLAVGGVPARKEVGVMSDPEERIESKEGPVLRMYRGEENELDRSAEADDFEEAAVSKRLAAEVEAFWAGRLPANRNSARVAA